MGASGTSEAAIAYKTAMMFNNGHAVLTYVPSSVNKTDLSDFLENNKGSSKFTSDQANRLRSLDIDESHYLAEFSSDRAYLPAGAFNITVFTPITKASEEIVGFQMSNLLKGVSSSISSNPEEARASKQGSPIDAQALVAVKFPEDSDGRMFVLNLPYYTNNIGAFIRDVDNRLAPFVTRMSVSDKERNNVIPPVTIEK